MNTFSIQLLTVVLVVSAARRISYTSTGSWEPAKNENCDRYMCSPNNLTWSPDHSFRFYNSTEACDALVKKGIRYIFYHGDSFMRQMYAAMLISLNGDYESGSLANPQSAPQCRYRKQFNEKSCGTRQLNHYGKMCNNQIIMDPLLNGFGDTKACSEHNGSVVLWSFGNYKLVRYGREGVNNATMYSNLFQRDICPKIRKLSNNPSYTGEVDGICSVFWVSTHYRLRAYFEDEKPEIVKEYNRGMRSFYDSGSCGKVNYLDVYNMTAALGLGHRGVAEQMSYDHVHWGMEVNLVKAQLIINALLSSDFVS